MLIRKFTGLVLVFILFPSLAGCVESSFELASDSRLPKWFDAPEGVKRGNLTITLDYYTDGDAVFTLYQKDRYFKLRKVKGTTRGDGPIKLKNPPAGFPKHYPMYEIITVGNVTEVIEHRRMEPIFYVADNPKILKELNVKVSR